MLTETDNRLWFPVHRRTAETVGYCRDCGRVGFPAEDEFWHTERVGEPDGVLLCEDCFQADHIAKQAEASEEPLHIADALALAAEIVALGPCWRVLSIRPIRGHSEFSASKRYRLDVAYIEEDTRCASNGIIVDRASWEQWRAKVPRDMEFLHQLP